MTDCSNDHGASDDDDDASQKETPFNEVLHEMLEMMPNALADAEVPQEGPVHQEKASRIQSNSGSQSHSHL
jgi:hypothetical protein